MQTNRAQNNKKKRITAKVTRRQSVGCDLSFWGAERRRIPFLANRGPVMRGTRLFASLRV